MIWMLTQGEYLHKVIVHFLQTNKYPAEIEAFLKRDDFEILDKSLHVPSAENVYGLAVAVHKVSVVTAFEQGKKIPDNVLQDYPWLKAKKLELPKNTFEYSFNKPDFKTAESFKDFLAFCQLTPGYKICTQFPLMNNMCYLWQGEEIRMATLENPLQTKGFTRVLVMQGEMGAVLNAVRYIEEHTGAKGEEGLYYVDFSTLHCMDAEEENKVSQREFIGSVSSQPSVYQLRKFGEFLSEYPLGEVQRSGDTADRSAYKFPWEMSVDEFVTQVENYVRKFNIYPLEITEALDIAVQMHPEMREIQQQKPSVELGAKAAVTAHMLLVSKAILEHKYVPPKVLALYPGLVERLEKLNVIQHGFDATDFKTAERFKEFLSLFGIRTFQKCVRTSRPGSRPIYMWSGEDIKIITAKNPLRRNGYASFIAIEGREKQVLQAVQYIEEHTRSERVQGLGHINFNDIICREPEPEDPSTGTDPTGKSPADSATEVTKPVAKKNTQKSTHQDKNASTNHLKNFASFLSLHDVINGYIDNGEIKETFGKLGKKAFKELAIHLGLKEYDIKFNKGGIAVSGDLLLMGMFETGVGIYISFNKDGTRESTDNVLYRTITDMKDFTGGTNHWFPESEFANPESIREKILSLFKQKESAVPKVELAKKQEAEKESPVERTKFSSGLDLIKHIDEALDKGHTDEAVSMIATLATELEQGHFIDQFPALLSYKQHPDLRKELSHIQLADIVTSAAFSAAVNTNLWKLIPQQYQTIRAIKPILWKADPSDKGLRLILSEFTSDNTLRPALWGASFDEKGIVATDATKLIFINTANPSKKGIYCITKFCFKSLGKPDTEEAIVKEKFPDYVSMLPAHVNVMHTVSTESIRTVCSTFKKTKILDERTPVCAFRFDEGKFIQINIDFLESCATAFARLGYSSVDIGFINFDKVMVMTPVGKMKDVSSLNTPFALLMPFVLNPKDAYVPQRGTLYFDFSDETVGTLGIEDKVSLKKETPQAIDNASGSEPDTLHLLTNGNWFSQHPEKVLHGSAEEIAEQLDKTPIAKLSPSTQSTPETNTEKSDYLDRVVAVMFEKYSRGERATKKQIEKLAQELGVSNVGKMWEAVELSWLLWYKKIYREPYDFETRLSMMTAFWNKVQPTYEYADSSKILYRQYSTPCPIGAIVSEYTQMNKAKSIFEPSAGNGLFLLGADPSKTAVNEIDATRLDSLKFQGFKKITNLNAAQPFPDEMTHKFDVVVTNPPFTRWEDDKFDKDYLIRKYFHNQIGLSKHLRLEHVMAGLALHTMKDTGKAAIIIMGHVYFSEDGYIAKYRPFFNWLYRHYNVEDVINLNSFKLYNKQGAIERTMLILINGRKQKPEGVAPRKTEAPHLQEIVNGFAELWERVRSHLKTELDLLIEQLNIALTP